MRILQASGLGLLHGVCPGPCRFFAIGPGTRGDVAVRSRSATAGDFPERVPRGSYTKDHDVQTAKPARCLKLQTFFERAW